MQQEQHITITGFHHYYALQPLSIGQLICCNKEPRNTHDAQAIRCSLPFIGTVGYVANSAHTTAKGTCRAGEIYAAVPAQFFVRVRFSTATKVICSLEIPEDRVDTQHFLQELAKQILREMLPDATQ